MRDLATADDTGHALTATSDTAMFTAACVALR
jgi:hypothetical protein